MEGRVEAAECKKKCENAKMQKKKKAGSKDEEDVGSALGASGMPSAH